MILKTPISFVLPGRREYSYLHELPLVITDNTDNKTVHVNLGENIKPLLLWSGQEYDTIGDYTQGMIENRIDELLTQENIKTSLYQHLYASYIKYNNKNYINPYIFEYNKCPKKDIYIIIAYFNPCNYKTTKENLLITTNKLIKSDYQICVIEAIMPKAEPLKLPDTIQHIRLNATEQNCMFLKENLYNIAVSHVQSNKYLFMDSDIIFDNPDWLSDSSLLLESYDMIQPFELCYWNNKDNNGYDLARECSAKCLEYKFKPAATRYHPGFAWGITKIFFDKMHGFYEYNILGGGDLSLWTSLDNYTDFDKDHSSIWLTDNELFYNTKSYKLYKKHITSLSPKIGYLSGTCVFHLYHGSRINRQYGTRYSILSDFKNMDNPVQKNQNGLLEWKDTKYAIAAYNYFLNRKEDDL